MRRELAVFLGGLAVAIAATWPLALHLFDLTRVTDRTFDDWVFYWNFAWFDRALFEFGANPLFCSEIFHPHGASLASSPLGAPFCVASLPLQLVMGRLAGSVAALKIVGLLSFALAVHGTSLFLRAHRVPSAIAFLAGCLFAFAPFHFLNLTRVHYLAGWTLPYFLWALTRAARDPRPARIAVAALLFALGGYCDASLLPLLVFAALALAWVLWREGQAPAPLVARFAASGLLGTILLLPILVPALRTEPATDMLEELAFDEKPDRYQVLFSPDLNALAYYVSPALHVALASDESEARESTERRIRNIHQSFRPSTDAAWLEALAAGAVVLLVLASLALGLRHPRSWPFAVLAVFAFLLSLGPYRTVGGDVIRMPYFYLAEYVPGMKAGRYVVANLRLFHLGLAVVAGMGLAAAPRWLTRLAWIALAACATAWIARPFRFAEVTPGPVHELMAQDPVEGAVLNVPQGLATREMALGQIIHGRPLMDGPIHRYPPEAVSFYEELPVVPRLMDGAAQAELEPDELARTTAENVRLLREHGVRYLVARPAGRYPKLLSHMAAYLELHEGIEIVLRSDRVLLARVAPGN